MTPEQLAKPNTEHAHQCALFCWANSMVKTHPELADMYAIPNGGERNRAVASRMVAEGVKKGIPDIHLPVARFDYIGLFIEMKKPGRQGEADGGCSQHQVKRMSNLESYGHSCRICYTWEEARDIILEYLQEEQ